MHLRLVLFAALAAAGSAAAQQPAINFNFAVPAAGAWAYAAVADGSEATFRDPSGRPQLTIRCTRSVRRVTISKPASAASPFLNVWTSSAARDVPAGFDPTTARANAVLLSTDPLLDALAFSRGRFAVALSGTPALVLPAWPEPLRVVEDCRA